MDQITAHPSSPDRLVGQAVSHYHVLQRLGAGGMGVVYKARDLQLDRHVALKFLRPYLHADEDARERFLREAKAASSLQDPHICTIYEIGETEDGQLFISMEFFEGETLEAKIKRGRVPAVEAIRYAGEIAEGLAHAHSAGIVHRDVKPSNVLVTEQGRIRLLDFGIAKIRDVAVTLPGTTLGTAAYMSPEQARGEAVDHRTDIWSLGVVLFELVTGRRPFPGDYEQAVLYAILNEDPVQMHPLGDDLPDGLEDIITTCLSKHPDNRYQHAREVQVALERLSASSQEEPSAGISTGARNLLLPDRQDGSEQPRLYLDESLSIFREIGDRNGIATVLNDLGWVSLHEGDTASARTLLHEALTLNRELKNARGTAVALHSLGWIEMHGNFHSARVFLEESLKYRREAGDLSGTAYEIANLAFVDQCQGRYAEAEVRLDDAFRTLSEVGHRQLIAWTRFVQAHCAYAQGRYEEAESLLLESSSSWREVDNRPALAWTLVLLANVARELDDFTRATDLLEESRGLWMDTGAVWGVPATLCGMGHLAAAIEDYAQALTLYSESADLCRSLDDKFVLIESLEAMAASHVSLGDFRSAVEPFAEADALRAMIQAPPPPRIRVEREGIVDALRTALGEEAFAATFASGTRADPGLD